jgi:hypothetical protein
MHQDFKTTTNGRSWWRSWYVEIMKCKACLKNQCFNFGSKHN